MCRCNLVDVTWKTFPIKCTMSGSFPPIRGSRGPRRRSALFQILSHLERIIIVRREGGEVGRLDKVGREKREGKYGVDGGGDRGEEEVSVKDTYLPAWPCTAQPPPHSSRRPPPRRTPPPPSCGASAASSP